MLKLSLQTKPWVQFCGARKAENFYTKKSYSDFVNSKPIAGSIALESNTHTHTHTYIYIYIYIYI
jgi:hypothetical protein